MSVCKHSTFYKMLWGRIILIIHHAPEENKQFTWVLAYISPNFNQ